MPGRLRETGAGGRGLAVLFVALLVVQVTGPVVAGATNVSPSGERPDFAASVGTAAGPALPGTNGAAAQSPVANSTTWPQFGADTANTGYNPDATGPTDSVTDLWNRTAKGFVYGSPAVVDGAVYAGHSTGNVTAVDAETGQLRWRTDTGATVLSSPAVVGGTVYVGNHDGKLVALDAADGSFEWNFTTGDSVQTAPAVVDGTVYFGSDDSSVYALDADTGAEQWSFSGSHAVRASPAVVDGTVYVGSLSTMYALDASTGAQRWSYSVSAASSPAVVNGTVYFGSIDASVYALDASTGALEWENSTSVRVKTSPAVANGTVFVGNNDGHLYALDATTGTQQWRFDAPNDVRASPSVGDGTVYFGVRSDDLYALDATDGSVRWNFPTPGEVYSPPALIDGTLYVGTRDFHSGRSTFYALSGPPRTTTAVRLDSTNTPVEEGETLEVTATVENTGRKTGAQTVSLSVDGTTRDTTGVTLAGGGSTTVTLAWATASGDAGGYTATVSTSNDSASTSVSVTSPGDPHSNFSVGIDSTNSPVVEGDTLEVAVTAANIGGSSGTQPVSLSAGGSQRDSGSVSLASGGSKTFTLSWATSSGDAGDYTATVASENDSASTAVEVAALGGSGADEDLGNQPPIIRSMSVSDDSPKPNQLLTLSVDATDPDGEVVSTAWSFGDGTTARGSEVTHHYDEAGLYAIAVTATDDDGATAVGSRQVLVQGSPLVAPIDECGVIDESGEYRVVADINGSEGACIEVTASHVSVAGGGHTVNGTEADGSVGVSVQAAGGTIEDVSVSDLEVTNWDRAVVVENATDVAVDGVTAENSGRYAIVLRGVEASEVVDTTVAGFNDASLFQAGIVLEDADDNLLEYNDVSEGGDIGSNVALRSGSDDNRLVGNDLHATGTGLEITESDGTVVRENALFENDKGVSVDRSDGTTIVDSEVTDNTYGISIHSQSENTLVRSTRVTENGPGQAAYGISITDNSDGTTLVNNTITRNDGGGISTALVWNVTIEGNTIASNRGIGVSLATTWNSTFRDNLLNNNTRATYGSNGLDADTGANLTVANNTFSEHLEDELSGLGGTAVSIEGYDDSVVRDNRIVDGTYGLYTTAGGDNRIVGNVVRNQSGTGLTVLSSLDVVVADNVVTGASPGMRVEQAARTTVRNNTLRENEPDLVVASDGGVSGTQGYDGTTVEETTIGTTVVGARFDGDGTIDAVTSPAPYPDRFDGTGSPLRLESPTSQSIDLTIHYGSVDDGSDLELWWHVDEWNRLDVAAIDEAADTVEVNLAADAVVAPVVDVSPDLAPSYTPAPPAAGESITFTAGLASDSTAVVQWDFDDDGAFERQGRSVTRAFDDPGNRTVVVRATTSDGVSTVANVSVAVAEREVTTVAGVPVEFSYSPQSPQVGETVTLSVSVEDPSVDPVAFEWDFGSDGTVDASGASASTTYEDPLSVTLTVRLSSGQEVTVSRTVVLGGTSAPDDSGESAQTGPVGQPGFGIGVTVAALLGIALFAGRRTG